MTDDEVRTRCEAYVIRKRTSDLLSKISCVCMACSGEEIREINAANTQHILQALKAAYADGERAGLERAAKLADSRAQYHRSVKSVGDISDWVADKLAHEIRQAAGEVKGG